MKINSLPGMSAIFDSARLWNNHGYEFPTAAISGIVSRFAGQFADGCAHHASVALEKWLGASS